MSVDSRAFDENVATWKAEIQQPWMALRSRLEQAHIQRHIGERPLRILDAGGGNGRYATTFAEAGHEGVRVDYSVDTQAAFDRVLQAVHPMQLATDRVHPGATGQLVLARAFLHTLGYEWVPDTAG